MFPIPNPTSLNSHTSSPNHQPMPSRFGVHAQFSKHVILFATSVSLFVGQAAAAPSCFD